MIQKTQILLSPGDVAALAGKLEATAAHALAMAESLAKHGHEAAWVDEAREGYLMQARVHEECLRILAHAQACDYRPAPLAQERLDDITGVK